MFKYITLKTFSIFISILAVIVLFLIFFVKPKPPQLITSTPNENEQQFDPTHTISLGFDRLLETDKLRFSSKPEEQWLIESTSNSVVTIRSKQYLHNETNYSLDIFYKDALVTTLHFKTMHLPGDPRYTQSVLQEMDRDYPLSTKFPYDTNAYHAYYGAPLSIEIRRKNDILTDEEIIDQVKDWVRSQGVDPSTHQYKVFSPSQ